MAKTHNDIEKMIKLNEEGKLKFDQKFYQETYLMQLKILSGIREELRDISRALKCK